MEDLYDITNKAIFKYMDKFFKTCDDSMGIPSIIIIDNKNYNLTSSIERHHLRKVMVNCLKNSPHYFDESESIKISDDYVEFKYNHLKKIILSL